MQGQLRRPGDLRLNKRVTTGAIEIVVVQGSLRRRAPPRLEARRLTCRLVSLVEAPRQVPVGVCAAHVGTNDVAA
jgi:hypothetical protein